MFPFTPLLLFAVTSLLFIESGHLLALIRNSLVGTVNWLDNCDHNETYQSCHDHDHKEGIHSDSSDASKPAGSHDTEVVGSHHHHDADEVFTSIGIETSTKYTKDKVEECLEELDDTSKYGTILRCKGMLPTEGDRFIHFDYVPGECEVRDGAAEVTGKICVIGSELKEDAIRELFK